MSSFECNNYVGCCLWKRQWMSPINWVLNITFHECFRRALQPPPVDNSRSSPRWYTFFFRMALHIKKVADPCPIPIFFSISDSGCNPSYTRTFFIFLPCRSLWSTLQTLKLPSSGWGILARRQRTLWCTPSCSRRTRCAKGCTPSLCR